MWQSGGMGYGRVTPRRIVMPHPPRLNSTCAPMTVDASWAHTCHALRLSVFSSLR